MKITVSSPYECKITEIFNQELGKRVALVFEGEDIQVHDEYHSMHDLYKHRMALNIALFNMLEEWNLATYDEARIPVMKSKFHHDGTMFEGGYFVVMAITPNGQISYHYKLKHWDKFKIPEVERIPFPYDGHTAEDTLKRLEEL